MSAPAPGPEDRPMKLAPHQVAFIETVVSPTSKRIVLLRGDVGIGKTAALVALASRLMREQPTARALLLCPAALRLQWVKMLRDEGTPALLVDRYKFREMLDASDGGEVWPHGVAVVLSDDFAKKSDIRESLAGVQWDMVIADEAHRFTGTRAELLIRVGATAKRVVLAVAPGMALPDAFPKEGATVLDWRRDRLLDHDGKPLDAVPRPVLREVPFTLSRAERDLSETVRRLCEVLDVDTRQSKFAAKILLRSLRSSPTALESVLRRLEVRLEDQHEINILLEEEDTDEMWDEERTSKLIDTAVAAKARIIVARALQELEAAQADSKLAAFSGLLADLASVETPAKRICTFTEYVGTLYYLAAEIEAQGLACSLLHGGMRHEARQESLAMFASTGGILVATRAVLTEGLSLPDVTDLVLYDLPDNDRVLRQVLGRFDRFGRTSRLNIHAFAQSDGADSALLEPIRLLHKMGASQQGNEEG